MHTDTETLQATDRCVQCGLCLPHCPTFRLTGLESESPRGRINLVMGLLRKQLEPDCRLRRHIDSCLGCLACETMCPSKVEYGHIIGAAKRRLSQDRGLSTLPATALRLADGQLPGTLLRLYRSSGAQKLVRASGLLRGRLRTLEGTLPAEAGPRLPAMSPTLGSRRGKVALFVGCAGTLFDAATQAAAVKLLNHAGFDVVLPQAHQCCGAIHHGAGDGAGFERHARDNLEQWQRLGADAILYTSSGCGLMLHDYQYWLGEEAAVWQQRLHDASTYIEPLLAELEFAPLAAPVAVHRPCSQKHPRHRADAAERLLHHIPGIGLSATDDRDCCGAAGSHMLRQPARAAALREPIVASVIAGNAPILATTNVGCALHLRAGVADAADGVEVLHPLTLLARQLKPPACADR